MNRLYILWAIQLAPLAAFVKILMMPKRCKKFAPLVGILFSSLAAILSVYIFLGNSSSHGHATEYKTLWLQVSSSALWPNARVSEYALGMGFLADPINLLMISLVTVISLCVQIFSFYYMKNDPSRDRYFAFLSFFSFAMSGLVLSNNLAQTFIFWELVGLASYLLIGFWYEKKSASDAARKAFVMNRLADLGFCLGIILLFIQYGTLEFTQLSVGALNGFFSTSMLAIITILVFTGIMGKSAQFPFHVWLPDAMEGPTPVSALLHSATMVAAGVFLCVRAYSFFSASDLCLSFILVTGSMTGLVGAFLATIQRDIKKILAYSTISQLGLMVMCLGAGSSVGAMFHLTTHAFFKSLLFLTAGAFIHKFHTNDIWDIAKAGGRQKKLATFMLCFGLLSLSGVPPLAGFFSKDMILEALKEHHWVFFAIGVVISFLTVYYSFRVLFILFLSKITPSKHTSHKHDDHAHAHETLLEKMAEAVPLVILCTLSLVAGAAGTELLHSWLLHQLGSHAAHMNLTLIITTALLIFSGAALAFMRFADPAKAETALTTNKGAWHEILLSKFYMDELYEVIVKKVALVFAGFLNRLDKLVFNKWLVDDTSKGIGGLGVLCSKLQSGRLQNYLCISFAVMALIFLALLVQ